MGDRGFFGREGSFADFFAREFDALVVFMARRLLDPQLALDLAAETFAAAFTQRAKFRGDDEATARAWLYAIARSQLSHYARKGAAESRAIAKLGLDVAALSEEEHRRIEEAADLESLRERVRAALGETSEAQGRALQLKVVEELPYAEVARQLGVSEQAARSRVSRGLAALAETLERHGVGREEVA